MLRRLFVIPCLIVGLIALAAPTAGAATVSPDAWAPKFCKALQRWQTTLADESKAATSALGNVSGGDLTAVRDEFVTFLGNDVAATQLAIRTIKKAGTPSSANGRKIVAKFIAGFQAASTVFSKAKTDAAALSTTDATAFVSSATQIESDLSNAGDTITTSFSGVGKLDKKNELSKAIQDAKACKFLTGS